MKIYRKICLISNFNKKIIRRINFSKKVKNSLSFYNSPNQKRSHTQNQVLKNKLVPQNTVMKSKMCSRQNEKHSVTVRLRIRVLIFMRLTAEQHCIKSVQIQSFFWSVFSSIRTEYRDLLRKFRNSVRTQENTDQKKLRIWTLFTRSAKQCSFTVGAYMTPLFSLVILLNHRRLSNLILFWNVSFSSSE